MRTIEKITESSSTPCMSGFEEKTTLGTIHTEFKLGCASIDEDRSFKVIVIWTRFSGILAGIRFPQRMKNIDLKIYENNEGVGGTWYSNREPHAIIHLIVQEVQTDWSAFYSPGPEILADLKRVANKYQFMRFIKLRHELIHASYDEKTGKRHLMLRRQILESQESEIVEDTADFVLLCTGSLSRWKWPDIDGLESKAHGISTRWRLTFRQPHDLREQDKIFIYIDL
ncbi:FAD/NAD-binding domain-containing protein [Sanghuangporus baumii]|uniref:FAD/NAD-binding domain-containing protein n=1 Tax=Sanghuangporus baumii TaxID=108892 RepID=A0A9Q5HYF3_SANBA|nr:FAD/NAD-binding domain-containing protein [Sanghuangporus baumii]